MAIEPVLALITQVTFILLAALTWVDWVRHPHVRRRDVMILFSAFALTVILQWLAAIFPGARAWLVTGENLALLAIPFLLLRLVQHSRPVPPTLMGLTFAGLVAAWALLLTFPAPVPFPI